MTEQKPTLCWIYFMADENLCMDSSSYENKESILSQGWICWRTAEGAKAAAEEEIEDSWEGDDDEEKPPTPDWKEEENGSFRWDVTEYQSVEVHPLRVQD